VLTLREGWLSLARLQRFPDLSAAALARVGGCLRVLSLAPVSTAPALPRLEGTTSEAWHITSRCALQEIQLDLIRLPSRARLTEGRPARTATRSNHVWRARAASAESTVA
jgi:hypothetical protein